MTLPLAFSRCAGGALAATFTLALGACGGGGAEGSGFFSGLPASSAPSPAAPPESSPPSPASTYSVSGTVNGLLGTGLVLQNNGGDDLPIAADGRFSFATPLAGGASYAVSIKSQSKILTRVCTVGNGSGTIAAAAVSDVQVVCAEPPSRFAYVSNGNSVSAYAIDATSGALGPATTLSVPSSYALTVDPSGRFVYVSSASGNGVSVYAVDRTTGSLQATGAPAVALGGTSAGMAVDPTGRFAYFVNLLGGGVRAFDIDAHTGALSPMAVPFVETGNLPYGIALDPSGRFAYVVSIDDATVSAFNIDATSGALTPMAIPTVATGVAPHDIAVDPSGRFAYVMNQADQNVTAYSIDPVSGALTPLAAARPATGWTATTCRPICWMRPPVRSRPRRHRPFPRAVAPSR